MSEKKKIVLFDIDYTLFNAQLFRESFFEILAESISYENKDKFFDLLENIYETSKQETSFFDPKAFLETLGQKIKLTKEKELLEKEIMKEEILESALYEETKTVLEALSRQKNIVLGILSWGSIPTQTAKIKLLADYLEREHIHIVEIDKRTILPKILKRYKEYKVFLIDDYQEVLAIAKDLHPDIHTIWIKRPETEGKESRIFDNFVPDSIINNLREVISFVIDN